MVSLPLQSVMVVANFCAAMDTLIDQDEVCLVRVILLPLQKALYRQVS